MKVQNTGNPLNLTSVEEKALRPPLKNNYLEVNKTEAKEEVNNSLLGDIVEGVQVLYEKKETITKEHLLSQINSFEK